MKNIKSLFAMNVATAFSLVEFLRESLKIEMSLGIAIYIKK